jgi:DNA invertase Pin-like site-specific DNA recombinase
MRTSSATNVGEGKDSERRQRAAIERYAKGAGFMIVDWFFDAAVKGADAIDTRPGFAALLDRIEGNGVRTVIVEDASRFARQLMAQETGIAMLIKRGVRLLTAGGDDLTDSDDPTRVMVRQILGAVSQNEKARLVDKLKKARERTGRHGGRKPYAETDPDMVELAKEIAGSSLHMSLRKIARELTNRGYPGPNGRDYPPASIKSMLAR